MFTPKKPMGPMFRRRACLAIAALVAALLPAGDLVGTAGAQVFYPASKSETHTPKLGCFNTVGCNFIYPVDIGGFLVDVHCTPNIFQTAIDGATAAGGYSDTGEACGEFALSKANGGSASYYCGYDGPGAPCENA